MPSLKSSEVHNETRQSLGSIGSAEEVSFQFRAKDSLSEGFADMRGREFQMEEPATVNAFWAEDKTCARNSVLSRKGHPSPLS